MTATMIAPNVTQWSPDQLAIFAHIERAVQSKRLSTGNLMVLAGPGAGKTTTMVEQVKLLVAMGVKDILVTAFGRGIVGELQQRLAGVAGVKVQSIYGVGFGVIGRYLRTAYNLKDITVEDS